MKIPRRRFLSSTLTLAAASTLSRSSLLKALPASDPDQTTPTEAELAKDPRRPQYHLLPARNWMNDPNGPIYWKGKYHMFFQYNPHAAVWGDMHWNHAVSTDMIHWRHLPIALAPTPGGPDADGCFTGTAVVNNGVPTLIYTGVKSVPKSESTLDDGHNIYRETQLYATSSDAMLGTWTKRPTPVIATPPPGLKVTGFRDPAPWREPSLAGGQWLMAVGSGIQHQSGMLLLYKSPDLQNWEYLHPLLGGAQTGGSASNPVDSGDMWECPDIFPLGNKHVVIYSTQGKALWKVGQIDPASLTFHEEQSGVLDHGSFYAPKTQLDKSGNRILWGWIPESRPEAEYHSAGWSGLMSLPRELTLGPDGRLRIAIIPQADKLRKHEQKLSLNPAKDGSKELEASARIHDACAELQCTVSPAADGNFAPFSLDLLNTASRTTAPATPTDAGSDATPTTSPTSILSIRYSHANPKELVVDQARLPLSLTPGQPLDLRFFIDGSVIELIACNQAAFTKRFYYPGQTAPEIAISITGDPKAITRLILWPLNPISKDRLTT